REVGAVAAFFSDLLAAGRSQATVRSYGMDLLRWFRFLLCTMQVDPPCGVTGLVGARDQAFARRRDGTGRDAAVPRRLAGERRPGCPVVVRQVRRRGRLSDRESVLDLERFVFLHGVGDGEELFEPEF
ncbi:MAG TPA: hypothetical protein VE197_11380, partial [Mycobacterium sp.]|nr:hypothetical protein [Mycobacterium sp.]